MLEFSILNFVIQYYAQDGKGVLIVDAGGGTVDISAYRKLSPMSPSYEEIAPPQCLGSPIPTSFISLIAGF